MAIIPVMADTGDMAIQDTPIPATRKSKNKGAYTKSWIVPAYGQRFRLAKVLLSESSMVIKALYITLADTLNAERITVSANCNAERITVSANCNAERITMSDNCNAERIAVIWRYRRL